MMGQTSYNRAFSLHVEFSCSAIDVSSRNCPYVPVYALHWPAHSLESCVVQDRLQIRFKIYLTSSHPHLSAPQF